MYHKVLLISHLVAGVIFVMSMTIHDKGVSQGIGLGLAILILGTLCFAIVPLMFLAISVFTRFVPVIGILVYFIMCIGNLFGESNNLSYPPLWIFASIWGWFNIRTAVIASRDDNFSPLTFFPG